MKSNMERSDAKVVFFSEFILASQNSTGYFWSKLIERATEDFGQVGIISPEPDIEGSGVDSSKNGNIYVRRIAYNKNVLLSRLFGQLFQAVFMVFSVIKSTRKVDIVVSGTNPTPSLILIFICKRLIGFKWILLVHDVYPENMIASGILKSKSMAHYFLEKIFNASYASADHHVVIGRDMAEIMNGKTKGKVECTVIQNWVDGDDVKVKSRYDSSIIKSLGWENRVVFQFFGNMGRVQGIDNIINAIDINKNPKAAFLFMGDGVQAEKVKKFADTRGVGRVSYMGAVCEQDRNEALAACDVAIVSLESNMRGLGVPSKAYFSLAADKPILAVMDNDSEVALMVKEDNAGWVCETSNPQALSDMIDLICSQDLSIYHGHQRSVALNKYSKQFSLDRFMQCIRSQAGYRVGAV